jgi:cell division septation protein DedD
MNRKTVLLTAAVGLVLLAVYGIWQYSPLKLLAPSKNQPRQTQAAALSARNQPVIVKKKIPPLSATGLQPSDAPQPLVVSKEVIAKNAPESVEPDKIAANSVIEKDKAPVLQPADRLPQNKITPESVLPQAAPKTVELRSESIAAKPQSHLPYSILLSSCRLPQSARKIVADYQKAGLAPYVVKVEFENGDVWLRVLAGQYSTRNEALKAKQVHHLSDAIVKKMPYANLVGSFTGEGGVKDSLKRLQGIGYSPYVVKRAENKFQVLVGAFITREGAEKQKSELQAKGIPSEIIDR